MGWREHPGVRTGMDLTAGERAADAIRNGMGSWPFVGSFLAVMAVWMGWNAATGLRWDPYPYILLNLALSTLAGLQGAILLIAAKRADQIASEVAGHTLANTQLIQQLVEDNKRLTEAVHQLTTEIHGRVTGPNPGSPLTAA